MKLIAAILILNAFGVFMLLCIALGLQQHGFGLVSAHLLAPVILLGLFGLAGLMTWAINQLI